MNYKDIYDLCHKNGYMEEHEIGSYVHLIEHIQKSNIEYNSVLDLGCSIGNGIKMFNDLGKQCTGFDVSEIAINHALSRNLKAVCGNAINLPFEDNTFDVVVSTDMLEHLNEQDVELAIKEIKRTTKKYIALKLAMIVETSNSWTNLCKNNGFDIPNLHLSIFNSEKWKSYFKDMNLIHEFKYANDFIILIYQK